MNKGFKTNMKIAESLCLTPGGCPKLKGVTNYAERVTKCAGCTNVLNKVDLVDLLSQLHNNDTPTTKPPIPTTGKGTELNNSEIRKILTLYHIDLIPITRIASDYRFSFRTVKNVVNQSFKNETSNEKVRRIIEEMKNDGRV